MSSAGRGFRFNEGDWTCPECSNVNFARRSECNRCGTERKYEVKKVKKGGIEIGSSAAEKSKGLFSADDWMCKTCGNVNWARRYDCNMCNTPKVDVMEERTGFGGGFNERAGVEYKEKEDSDGEFDEFGRRKKKFRGPISSTGEASVTNDKRAEYDEEEESGSDEDVSKYDLDASDDENDDADAGKYDCAASSDEGEKKSKPKSHSRSRSRSGSRINGIRNSRSRSNSRSRRHHRSSSSSSNSSHGNSNHRSRHDRKKKSSRSRSRSPHHRRRRSSSSDRRKHRR